ncbi:MAG: general secretion pathway protein GspK [Phycisphaerae bacterium]|nr:general secretion pathway protein GspK [Phycisphaerae bacterium]
MRCTCAKFFRQRPAPQRQGIIFVAALGVILVLTTVVLVLAQNMRTESLASANRVSYLQADAVEQGAEKWVLANVESAGSVSLTVTQIPANAMQLNSGYFWLISPDPDSDQIQAYGMVDETRKLNINVATEQQLMALPNMTQDIADSIISWRGATSTSSSTASSGATDSYYQSLTEPYAMKNAPFESIEELLLIKDIDQQLLYGYDINRDGVLSTAEQQAAGAASTVNSTTNGTRGIANDLTIYTTQAESRINVNGGTSTKLQNLLLKSVSSARANVILNNITTATRAARGRPPFGTLADFYTASGMSADEFKALAGLITTNTATTVSGLINPNTAGREVLGALFTGATGTSLTSSDADAVISARANATNSSSGSSSSSVSSNSTTTNLGWVVDALGPTKAATILNSFTTGSYQYSADIVAVSPDGRSFKRVRIVVDDRNSPAKIIYRKDLTSLGWPLPQDIRTALRSGQPIGTDQSNTNTLSNSVTGS